MRPLFALAVLSALAPAAPAPKAVKKQGDMQLIAGTWKPAEGKTEWFRFDADGTMKAWVTGGENTPYTYTYTLDAEASPKRMTWTVQGEAKPYYRCVYELDGDRLRMKYVGAGSDWPAKVAPDFSYYCEQTREPAK